MADIVITNRDDVQPGWYVLIDRDYAPVSLAVGPYRSEKVAVSAMNHSLLVDDLCQTDCLDATVVPESGLDRQVEVALIDDDPHHYGPVR